MTPGMMLAYDATGAVVGTLDFSLVLNADGSPRGFVDFAGHEESGQEATAYWSVSAAIGSKFWPEWIGGRAHGFRVELVGPPGRKRIAALVHNSSGHRRVRAAIEAAIAARRSSGSADLRDIVGGPARPLPLNDDGTTGEWGDDHSVIGATPYRPEVAR